MEKEKIGIDAATINTLVDAIGAVVRAQVAVLSPTQQKVFLTRLMDAADSAEKQDNKKLESLILSLAAAGQTEQRPESSL